MSAPDANPQAVTAPPAAPAATPANGSTPPGMSRAASEVKTLPDWATELITLYESNATNQFVLYGNIYDRMVLPLGAKMELGSLSDFLLRALLPRFDVILSYDLGNGIRIEKGGEIFSQWPAFKENSNLPRDPRAAIETLTHYFRYCANLAVLKRGKTQVGCLIKTANLVAPALQGGLDYDLNALALLMRDWGSDTLLSGHDLATFLLTENLNDLHSLLANNPRAAHVKVPLPTPDDLQRAFEFMAPSYKTALAEYSNDFTTPAHQLAGATLSAVETMFKTREYRKQKIVSNDLAKLKKQLVEKDCGGLIEFIESKRSLDDVYGQEKIKTWLRQDIALWKQNDLEAMPMGYLLCGPVGTGKTYMVECLAGEAGVPVVRLKNFRDKWVGSTEGNLEKIFRLLHALGRCYVFVDEADQALGKRDSGNSDSGLSGRIYSMLAEEMSNTGNRGKILWVLASSRPDLIEVDLKRPGRIDVKIPIFPTTTTAESFHLIRALAKRRGLAIEESHFAELEPMLPLLLTPGAAEALAIKVYRLARVESLEPLAALKECLVDYQNPVPHEVMEFQMQLAIREASDLDFVPPALRGEKKI
ncbi:MAG TPA: ATP-binding protein [Abditibacteriaceae bacterium]|nr:ATP-binding protein [Abditibacteriaceae bacterium]